MAKAYIVRDMQGNFYALGFKCPGCSWPDGTMQEHYLPVNNLPSGEKESPHAAGRPHWDWNGSLDAPTVSPSVLSRTDGYTKTDGRVVAGRCCHSFVRDGKIQFLPDCTHHLAGHTVDLPDIGDD